MTKFCFYFQEKLRTREQAKEKVMKNIPGILFSYF